jgi:hypothetical protein
MPPGLVNSSGTPSQALNAISSRSAAASQLKWRRAVALTKIPRPGSNVRFCPALCRTATPMVASNTVMNKVL